MAAAASSSVASVRSSDGRTRGDIDTDVAVSESDGKWKVDGLGKWKVTESDAGC
jgi:hypothetical protein